MKNYWYDVITATVVCGVKGHPRDQMRKLGFEVVMCEKLAIANSWCFKVRNSIDEVPEYLRLLPDDYKFKGE